MQKILPQKFTRRKNQTIRYEKLRKSIARKICHHTVRGNELLWLGARLGCQGGICWNMAGLFQSWRGSNCKSCILWCGRGVGKWEWLFKYGKYGWVHGIDYILLTTLSLQEPMASFTSGILALQRWLVSSGATLLPLRPSATARTECC